MVHQVTCDHKFILTIFQKFLHYVEFNSIISREYKVPNSQKYRKKTIQQVKNVHNKKKVIKTYKLKKIRIKNIKNRKDSNAKNIKH